jgi:hypothetical protein
MSSIYFYKLIADNGGAPCVQSAWIGRIMALFGEHGGNPFAPDFLYCS